MAYKVFLSTWTWRSLDHQAGVLESSFRNYTSLPRYVDNELFDLVRPTSRKTVDSVYAVAMPVFAKDEAGLIKFLAACKQRGLSIVTIEEDFRWSPNQSPALAVKVWRQTRRNGSAKRGGQISGANREARVKAGADRIKAKWPLAQGEWPTAALLKEAGISLNSAIKHLGRRPLAQANHQAALRRAAKRQKAKAA